MRVFFRFLFTLALVLAAQFHPHIFAQGTGELSPSSLGNSILKDSPDALAGTPERRSGGGADSVEQSFDRGLNYLLVPGDIVTLRVFQEDDMESQQRISQDGSVFFPLIGKTQLGDLTVGEATRKVTALLKEKYFVNPQVSLSIDRYAPRRFSVLGQVTEPNTYTIPDEEVVSLPMAIAMAGGHTRLANPRSILVSRKVKNKIETYRLDLRAPESRDFMILPGDIITVPERLF